MDNQLPEEYLNKHSLIYELVALILRYLSAGLLIGSLFYLALHNKVDSSVYLVFTSSALAALGVHRIYQKK